MDKKKPTYNLKAVRKLIEEGKLAPNLRILQSANELGFSNTEMYDEIQKLDRSSFCRSMTENYNHEVWVDVYKKVIKSKPIYIKFKITRDGLFLLTSFKVDTDKE